MSVPSGKGISDPLTAGGFSTAGEIAIVLDPVLQAGGIVGEHLVRLPVSDLIASGDGGVLAKVPVERVPGADRLLLWRRRS